MKRDYRSITQMYRDMHESAPLNKKAEKAVDKALDDIESPVEKLEALDGMVKKALTAEAVANAATLEFGSTSARDTYASDTPGQSGGDPAHEPTHAMKAKYGLSVNGVPDKGGSISKPDFTTTTGIKVEGHDTEAELVEAKEPKNCGCGKDPCETHGEQAIKEVSDATKTSYIKKAGQEVTSREKVKIANKGWTGKTGDTITKYHDDKINKRHKGIRAARGSLKKTVSEVASMNEVALTAKEVKDGDIRARQARQKQTNPIKDQGLDQPSVKLGKKIASMAKEDIQFDESMSVTLRKSKSQPGSYKVHSVGSKMKAHGGMKPGERVKDHHIDDLNDSGIKVKYRKEMTEYQAKLIEGKYTDKEVRMAKGIAFDKRHVGGDYTGAAKKMEKIKKGLSDHPTAKSALRRANEQIEFAQGLFKKKVEIDEVSNELVKKVANKRAINTSMALSKSHGDSRSPDYKDAAKKQSKNQMLRFHRGGRQAGKIIKSLEKQVGVKEDLTFKIPKGEAGKAYQSKKAAQRNDMNVKNDPGAKKKGLALSVVDRDKAAAKAKKKGVKLSADGQMTRPDKGRTIKKPNLPEAVERRADRKTIMATDPTTGKKILKIAPRKEIEIGLGKDA